tara:strand:- start:2178 stop:2444 length:267 start_codon:yes stop_codon:yes gene_type:complete
MEYLGIGIVIAVVGFVVYKSFWDKDDSASSSAPVSAPAPAEAKVPSKSDLNKMTKKELDNFAKAEFGVKLDARLKKDDMIKAFQKEVK